MTSPNFRTKEEALAKIAELKRAVASQKETIENHLSFCSLCQEGKYCSVGHGHKGVLYAEETNLKTFVRRMARRFN